MRQDVIFKIILIFLIELLYLIYIVILHIKKYDIILIFNIQNNSLRESTFVKENI